MACRRSGGTFGARARAVCAAALVLGSAGAGVAGSGCSGKAPPKKVAAEPVSAAERLPPGFKLDLPTAPIVAKKSAVPARYPDGAYSVHGALASRDALLGKDLEVTGFIVKLHRPTEKECEAGCTPAHFYLADAAAAAGDQPRLLVADFDAEQGKALVQGARARLTGQLTKQSTSGFSRTEGLLSFKGLKTPDAP